MEYCPSLHLVDNWKERNQRCFEGKQNNIQKIKTNYCLGLYYFWCKQVVIGDAENVLNITDWLYLEDPRNDISKTFWRGTTL